MDIQKEIQGLLSEYVGNIRDVLEEVADEVVSENIDFIKGIGNYSDKRGKYRKGFYKKNTGTRIAPSRTLANKQYQLTHLLQNGHLTPDGKSRTKAYPHWDVTAEKMNEEFENKLMERLQK